VDRSDSGVVQSGSGWGGGWSVAADNNNGNNNWNARGQSSLKVSLQIEWERQQITSKTYLNICRHLAFSGASV